METKDKIATDTEMARDRFETLHFEVRINASKEKVYNTMLDEKYYTQWTSAFNPGSSFRGSWEKGSRIEFLGQDGKGEIGGMISMIRENQPFRFVSIEHIGIIENGKEIMDSEQALSWSGAMENYTFRDENKSTLLLIDIDILREFRSFMVEAWPRALKALKEICEKG
jgi:hypothetical protein